MSINNSEVETQQVVTVNWAERWSVYYRLQELQIPCKCSTNQPLQVQLDSTKTAIQLWSVARQFNGSRQELVDWLECCWQLKSARREEYN
ncbi:hypothetical protein IQ238_09665 [Pleurocapsales cyanobacterium LEGE 06147]|nr:hypothetical protein [Pleurocapsales cyanobacterium LEGE 06147]